MPGPPDTGRPARGPSPGVASSVRGERSGRGQGYRRRDPQAGVLYQVLAEHLETFLSRADGDGTLPGLPRFVARELRAYLRCGILCHGFARVHCSSCGRDALVAFSCKGRGFCPSCGGRRMAETAAHLIDNVLPDLPVRQWVVSFPWRIRFLLARNARLCGAVRRLVLRAIFTWYRRRAGFRGRTAQGGAVCVDQRFGGALNLNLHFHALVLDGVYSTSSLHAPPLWQRADPPSDEDVLRLCRTIRIRVLRLLHRRGLLDEAPDTNEQPSLLTLIAAASVQGRIALEPEAGARLGRLGTPVLDPAAAFTAPLCGNVEGFSLHAAVRVPAGQRDRLERLCRYVSRPALAMGRLSFSRRGNILLRLRRPWRDGTSHLVFEPLAFIERLASLIPIPRAHQLTYHGVLAPAAALRDEVVPRPPSSRRRMRGSDASGCGHSYSWPELMRRVFDVDVLRCSYCGSRRRLIALITQPEVIRRILSHLGISLHPPFLAPARSPPEPALPF